MGPILGTPVSDSFERSVSRMPLIRQALTQETQRRSQIRLFLRKTGYVNKLPTCEQCESPLLTMDDVSVSEASRGIVSGRCKKCHLGVVK